MYKGNLLANIFLTNKILQIDPNTGAIISEFDMKDLTNDLESQQGYSRYVSSNINFCLNGIAYNEKSDRLVLTGKKWPFLYEIKLNDK